MNIYRVSFLFRVNSEGDQSDFAEDDEVHTIDDYFSIGAGDLLEATAKSIDYLDERFENWEMTGINLVADDVINWPDVEEEEHWSGDCECPYEAVKHSVLDNILNFKCSCGNSIKIANNGWESIKCLSCGNWINKDELVRNDKGILVYQKYPEDAENGKIPD